MRASRHTYDTVCETLDSVDLTEDVRKQMRQLAYDLCLGEVKK